MIDLVILLVTGFFIYYLIRHPVRSFKIVLSVLGLLLLGSAVWFGLFAWLMNSQEIKINIGDVVKYVGEFGEAKIAKITAIGSDKDSYNDVTLKDGVFLTYSKKLKKYVPIKGKSLDSVYIEIVGNGGSLDFILPSEIITE